MPALRQKYHPVPDHRRSLSSPIYTPSVPLSLPSASIPTQAVHKFHISELIAENGGHPAQSAGLSPKVTVPLPAIVAVVLLIAAVGTVLTAFLYYHYYIPRKRLKKFDLIPRPLILSSQHPGSVSSLNMDNLHRPIIQNPVSHEGEKRIMSSLLQTSFIQTSPHSVSSGFTTDSRSLPFTTSPAENKRTEGRFSWDFYCKGDHMASTGAKNWSEMNIKSASRDHAFLHDAILGGLIGRHQTLGGASDHVKSYRCRTSPAGGEGIREKLLVAPTDSPTTSAISSGVTSLVSEISTESNQSPRAHRRSATFTSNISSSEKEKKSIRHSSVKESNSPRVMTSRLDNGNDCAATVEDSDNFVAGEQWGISQTEAIRNNGHAWRMTLEEELNLIGYNAHDCDKRDKKNTVFSKDIGSEHLGRPEGAHIEPSSPNKRNSEEQQSDSGREACSSSVNDNLGSKRSDDLRLGGPGSFPPSPTRLPSLITIEKYAVNPKHRDLTPAKSCLKNTPTINSSRTLPTLPKSTTTTRSCGQTIIRKPSFEIIDTSTPLKFPIPPTHTRLPKSVSSTLPNAKRKAPGPVSKSRSNPKALVSDSKTDLPASITATSKTSMWTPQEPDIDASSELTYLRFPFGEVDSSSRKADELSPAVDTSFASRESHIVQAKSVSYLPVLKQGSTKPRCTGSNLSSGKSSHKHFSSAAATSHLQDDRSSLCKHSKSASASVIQESPTLNISRRLYTSRLSSAKINSSAVQASRKTSIPVSTRVLTTPVRNVEATSTKKQDRPALAIVTNIYAKNNRSVESRRQLKSDKLTQEVTSSYESSPGLLDSFSLAEDDPDPFANYSPPPFQTNRMSLQQSTFLDKGDLRSSQIVVKVRSKGVDSEEVIAMKISPDIEFEAFSQKVKKRLGYEVEFYAPIDDGSRIGLSTQTDFTAWIVGRMRRGANNGLEVWPKTLP